MKYIMIRDEHGRRLPIIFPDCLVHADVAKVMDHVMFRSTGSIHNEVLSAGFVDLGTQVTVHGRSESMELDSNYDDTAYIILGDSVSLSPPEFALMMLQKMKEAKEDKDQHDTE